MSPPFTTLGRYRIVRELGRGAMGVVYLAEDESLQRQVAVKTLQLPDGGAMSRQLEARFWQEAKAAGGQNHPNIITIYDLGREGDSLYIAMELLQGSELRDLMLAAPLPLERALDIAAQVAHGLAAAHARGVVHRDIKPGNIMVLPDGHAKIMDFGIARMQASDVRTQSGTMMGSPKYMSPEQVGGHPVDHRSDVFSLGSMLYEMVAGTPAFTGDNLGQLLSAILHATPIPLRQLKPALPERLEALVARAMQKNANARYQDVGEMARELQAIRAALPNPGATATDIDLGIDTLPTQDRTQVMPGGAPTGWAPSPHFDSSAALQRLLAGAAPASAAPAKGLPWLAWAALYLLAAAGAAAFALAGTHAA